MPKPSAKRSKNKRDDRSDSENSDDECLHFFVPGEKIDGEVLASFLFNYIDKTPRIRTCQHPTDRSRTGFNVTARRVLNITNLRDIMSDTRDWDTEMNDRSFKQQPYRYHESATAKRRLRAGPTKSREETESQQAPMKSASPPIANAVQPGAYGNLMSQQQQQYQQQPSDFSRQTPGYYPPSGKPEPPSGTYNINYTTVNAQYTSNVPGTSQMPSHTGGYQKPYHSTGYPQQTSKNPQDPPSYDQSGANPSTFDQQTPKGLPGKPQPGKPQPGHPDPDAFTWK